MFIQKKQEQYYQFPFRGGLQRRIWRGQFLFDVNLTINFVVFNLKQDNKLMDTETKSLKGEKTRSLKDFLNHVICYLLATLLSNT